MKLRSTHALVVLPAALLSWLLACSGTNPDGSEFKAPENGTDAGTEDVSTGNLPETGTETGAETGEDTGPLLDTGLTGDGSLTKDAACAVEHVEAEEIPIDLYIMADRSSSMLGSGWDSQSAGLNSFFSDPLSEGIWIALSFFPFDGECSSPSDDPTCSGQHYYKPQVQWGELPGHASLLASTIGTTAPEGCTPTQDALNGALRGAFDRQSANKDHVVAAVIVSDGEPCCGMCPIEEASGLGQIAAQYANGSPSIKTFAIYAASSASTSMSAIAASGGTQQAYNATGGTSAFITALDSIRTALIACEYKMPTPEAGVVNPELIEVEYTPSTGTAEQIPRITPPQDCGTEAGWHYDDETNPTRIILCPATCDAVQGDEDGQVDILVGCESGQR